ncbi:MAG: MarR family winged helix-turn-helix transcriptional regulator [Pseudorhizobium sp.]
MNASLPTALEFHAACVCLGLNRAARATARRYDAALKPVGITSGQFSILSSLTGDTKMTIGSMAERLGLERTTLKRNLEPLEAQGLLQVVDHEQDRRQRLVLATKDGLALLARAYPLWLAAQEASTKRIGDPPWTTLRAQLDGLT